jgi:hypothetical protein
VIALDGRRARHVFCCALGVFFFVYVGLGSGI